MARVKAPSATPTDSLAVRVGAYELLSAAMTHPYADTVRHCLESAGTLAPHFVETPGVAASLHDMAALDIAPEAVESLEVEYTRLFVNAYPKTPLPPYESVQRGEGLLWGEMTVQVLQGYLSRGVAFRKANGVAPDHLSAEFEFAGMLLAASQPTRCSHGSKEAPISFTEFFTDHLEPWAGEFCDRVERESRVEFFRVFGRLGSAFMHAEAERVLVEGRPVVHG